MLEEASASDAAPTSLGQPPDTVLAAAGKRSWWHGAVEWFSAKENLAVCCMAVVVLAMHIGVIGNPPQQMFDEQHYVPEANYFLHGEKINRPEHPPLSKWIIAASIRVFGDNSVGWRAFSVLFGIASIFIFYLICVRLVRREEEAGGHGDLSPPAQSATSGWFNFRTFVPVLATFLFATDNMNFVQSSIAMLDVFYVTFMLLAFLLYLRRSYAAAGVVMGLSMLSKTAAVLPLAALLLHFVVSRRSEVASELKHAFNIVRGKAGTRSAQSEVLNLAKLVVLPAVVWLALLPPLEYAVTHTWENPLSRTWHMYSTYVSMTTVAYPGTSATAPWSWLVMPLGMFYWYTPHYLGAVGWTVWVLIVPAIALLLYYVVKSRVAVSSLALFAFSWVLCTYLVLIPSELASKRLMFTFYFYPAIGAICMGIALGAWRLWQDAARSNRTRKLYFVGMTAYLAATVVGFVILSPYGGALIPLPV